MKEEWKIIEIPEFQGNYEVSTLGRIRTIPHLCRDKFGRERWVGEHIKATRINPKGYKMINVRYDNKHYTFRVHRIVALTFLPNPDNLPEVNHKDEDKGNNRVDNLEWCTHKYNSKYGTRSARIGEKSRINQTGRKLSEETKRKISDKAIGRKHSEKWKKQHAERMRKLYRQGRLTGLLNQEARTNY